ncbi:unnamed protein product [Chrysodeixis includens]|uniref:Telomere length regulation protein conserved domain-containing protein n=1 Tax=Chrysodeixis includens TaxID=689277 RepID=A0A9N8KVY9_CHRIL|nr:unnamed protein product [Chrysodeixis includens]
MYQTVLGTFRYSLFAEECEWSEPGVRALVQALRHATRVVYESADAGRVALALQAVRARLPPALTVQRLCGADPALLPAARLPLLADLLSACVRALLPRWPLCRDLLAQLFTLEESFALSHDTLALLCGFLHSETEPATLRALAHLLLRYAKSDAVLAAVLDATRYERGEPEPARRLRRDTWEDYVQLLVSLPERVANRLRTDTPKGFSRENYSHYIFFHIIRAIEYMVESTYHHGDQYNVKLLAHLVSKMVTNYYMSGNSPALLSFVDILAAWADATDHNKFVKRKLIQTLLRNLIRQAIEYLSITLLRRCPINYLNNQQIIYNVIGENYNSNPDWKQILSYKIPFNIRPKDFNDTIIAENLMYYFCTTRNSEHNVSDLIMRLCAAWSDVTRASDLRAQLSLAQLLALAVRYRVTMSLWNNTHWRTHDLKALLFKGMAKHLDMLAPEIRCIGMATVEIILKILSEIEENKAGDLEFDYESMGDTCKEIHKSLKDISMRCLIDHRRLAPDKFVYKPPNIKRLLDNFAYKFMEDENSLIHNTIVTCAVKGPEQTKEIVKTIISVKLDALDGKPEDLDSDDDLVPYDMSNDVHVNVRKQPHYLRDLLELLAEADDAEVFEACLEVAEDLVNKQLRNEDPKLTVDLLDLFVHLDAKYQVEGFDLIKFNTCVAVVCCQPRVGAEHLCKEIHTDVGRYSIATKVFMLDVISEAVNRIADVRAQSEPQPKDEVICEEQAEPPAEEIIRRRLINKTRYFHTMRQHPFAKAKKNQFASVSDYFFYPLLGGFGHKQLTLSHHNLKQDVDSILLLKYLTVIGNVVLASKNCPKCSTYCWEVVRIIMYLRYTPDPKIQMCVMTLLASVVISLPASVLNTEFFDVIVDLGGWLSDSVNKLDLMSFGGPKSELAMFAAQLLRLIKDTCS